MEAELQFAETMVGSVISASQLKLLQPCKPSALEELTRAGSFSFYLLCQCCLLCAASGDVLVQTWLDIKRLTVVLVVCF